MLISGNTGLSYLGHLRVVPRASIAKSMHKADWLVDTKWYHVVSTNQSVLRIDFNMVVWGTIRKCQKCGLYHGIPGMGYTLVWYPVTECRYYGMSSHLVPGHRAARCRRTCRGSSSIWWWHSSHCCPVWRPGRSGWRRQDATGWCWGWNEEKCYCKDTSHLQYSDVISAPYHRISTVYSTTYLHYQQRKPKSHISDPCHWWIHLIHWNFKNIFIIDCTENCQNDNFQWWKCH